MQITHLLIHIERQRVAEGALPFSKGDLLAPELILIRLRSVQSACNGIQFYTRAGHTPRRLGDANTETAVLKK